MNFAHIKRAGTKDLLLGMALEHVNGMNRRSSKVPQTKGCVRGRGDN